MREVANATRNNLIGRISYDANRNLQDDKVSSNFSAVWWTLLALIAIFVRPSSEEIAFGCVKIERACQKHINHSLFTLFVSRGVLGFAVGFFLKSLDSLLAKKLLPAKISTDYS